MPDRQPAADVQSVMEGLAEELLRLHKESYGRGASHAHAHLLDDAVICFMDGLELMPNEEFLIDAGKADAVVEVRSRYQQAIETTFWAAVERATGRRVVSFASTTKLSPHYAVEIFRLGPAKDIQLEEPR